MEEPNLELGRAVSSFADALVKTPHGIHYFSNYVKAYKADLEKIREIKEAYQSENREAVRETVTGGLFLWDRRELEVTGFYARTPFTNETPLNHIESEINRQYTIFKEVLELIGDVPSFFVNLENLADEYFGEALCIRRDIFLNDAKIKEFYTSEVESMILDEDLVEVKVLWPTDKNRFKEVYLDAEFNRRKELIPLLEKYELFFQDVIALMEQSLHIAANNLSKNTVA